MDIPVRGRRCTAPDVDPDWWVEDDDLGIAENRDRLWRAQLLCYECPLIGVCREAGWDEPAHVWGGLTAGERYRARVEGKVRVAPRRPKVDRSVKVLARVRELYLAGATPWEVAAAMNLSVERVRHHVLTILTETRIFQERLQRWGSPPALPNASIGWSVYRSGLEHSLSSLPESA